MSNNEIPNRCVCGYKLVDHEGASTPCPYHGTSTPMTAPLPVTPNMVRNSPVFASFSPEAREAIAQSAC